ncbi:hypothetical protein AC578_4219 [Pseudocercospora eumusae]|uniref:Uncharacterized protein n=1 Tax=Pseudocercospora eumusae TaxID=321146 RepID=A0A139H3A1_9PEZI|nr:hypothetical protein AC578_4219 [Pseudocercospora eumusae]
MPATTRFGAAKKQAKGKSKSRKSKSKHDSDDDYSGDDYSDDDSNEQSDDDDADYVELFAGRSKQEILDGKHFDWSQIKHKIVKHAVCKGYSANGLPTVKEVLDLIDVTGLPLFAGKRVAAICVDKLLKTIASTISETWFQGLIRFDDNGVVLVSAALVQTVKRSDFSAAHLDKRGKSAMMKLHADNDHRFHAAKPRRRVSPDRLAREVMQQLILKKLITNEDVVEHMAYAKEEEYVSEEEEEEEESVPVQNTKPSFAATPRAKKSVSLPLPEDSEDDLGQDTLRNKTAHHAKKASAPPCKKGEYKLVRQETPRGKQVHWIAEALSPPAPRKKEASTKQEPSPKKETSPKKEASPEKEDSHKEASPKKNFTTAAIPIQLPKALMPTWGRLSLADRQNIVTLITNMRDCGVDDDSIINVVEKKLIDIENGIEPGQSVAGAAIKEESEEAEQTSCDSENGGGDGDDQLSSDVGASGDEVGQASHAEASENEHDEEQEEQEKAGSDEDDVDCESASDEAEQKSCSTSLAGLEAFMKANNFTQEHLSMMLLQSIQAQQDTGSTPAAAGTNDKKEKKKKSKAKHLAKHDKPAPSSPASPTPAQAKVKKVAKQRTEKEAHNAAKNSAKAAA